MSANAKNITGQCCRRGCCGPLIKTTRPNRNNQQVKRIRRRHQRRAQREAIAEQSK
jgi:hypothetical protein